MLKLNYSGKRLEAGCDEAGRGCLAGPVFAAAVILPEHFENNSLNDSKKLSKNKREELREIILNEALYYAVAKVSNQKIDEINILNASILSMHIAIKKLEVTPEFLLIDGNRFTIFKNIMHECIIKGDGKYMSIAAASILAKTYRDDYMLKLHKKHPVYDWQNNKGYPTPKHREGIRNYGITSYHRKSFRLNEQLKLDFQSL